MPPPSNSDHLVKVDFTTPADERRGKMQRRPSGKRMKALMAFKEATKSAKDNITSRDNFTFKRIVRKSRQIDMETGVTQVREFTAQRVEDEEYFRPMSPAERRKKLFMKKRSYKKLLKKEEKKMLIN